CLATWRRMNLQCMHLETRRKEWCRRMSSYLFRRMGSVVVLLFLCLSGGLLRAQDTKPAAPAASGSSPKAADPSAKPGDEQDPLKRQISDKQKKENEKSLKQELSKTYQK